MRLPRRSRRISGACSSFWHSTACRSTSSPSASGRPAAPSTRLCTTPATSCAHSSANGGLRSRSTGMPASNARARGGPTGARRPARRSRCPRPRGARTRPCGTSGRNPAQPTPLAAIVVSLRHSGRRDHVAPRSAFQRRPFGRRVIAPRGIGDPALPPPMLKRAMPPAKSRASESSPARSPLAALGAQAASKPPVPV